MYRRNKFMNNSVRFDMQLFTIRPANNFVLVKHESQYGTGYVTDVQKLGLRVISGS
jgi:hypothetical protein